jgi:hypothetical protein
MKKRNSCARASERKISGAFFGRGGRSLVGFEQGVLVHRGEAGINCIDVGNAFLGNRCAVTALKNKQAGMLPRLSGLHVAEGVVCV